MTYPFDIDTGVGALPAARASVFSPPATGATIVRPTPTQDYGVGVTPMPTVNVFDDTAGILTVSDPGAA